MRLFKDVQIERPHTLLDNRCVRFVANALKISQSAICKLWHRYNRFHPEKLSSGDDVGVISRDANPSVDNKLHGIYARAAYF